MIEPLVALLARVGARFIGLESAVYLAAAVKVYSGPPLQPLWPTRGGAAPHTPFATESGQGGTGPAGAALARPSIGLVGVLLVRPPARAPHRTIAGAPEQACTRISAGIPARVRASTRMRARAHERARMRPKARADRARVQNLTNDEPSLAALAASGLCAALTAALSYQCATQRGGGGGGSGGGGAANISACRSSITASRHGLRLWRSERPRRRGGSVWPKGGLSWAVGCTPPARRRAHAYES
jgi:hypothetical protein